MKSKKWYLVKVSLKKKLKTKWFIGINIFLFIILFLIININSIINLFGGDYTETKYVKIVDNVGIYDELKESIEKGSVYSTNKFSVERIESYDEKTKLNNNEIILIVMYDYENYVKAQMYTNNEISVFAKSVIHSSLNKSRYNIALEDSNISEEMLKKINASVNLEHSIINKRSNNTKNDSTQNRLGVVAVIFFTMPFFFIITTLVQMVGSEINEEKSTKAMEIIISNVDAKEHLIAKITSCTLYTIIQILLVGVYALIGVIFRQQFGADIATENNQLLTEIIDSMISPEIIASLIRILPLLIIFLIFTFLTYAMIAGVFASVTTNIDDFQQLQTPILLTISSGFYLSILASIFEGSRLIKFLSYVPLVSFMLSPSLYMLKQVSIISVVISTIIQVIFTLLVIKYGFKIYRIGILNYSGNNLWKKIFHAIRS